jgi:hypothetical protein
MAAECFSTNNGQAGFDYVGGSGVTAYNDIVHSVSNWNTGRAITVDNLSLVTVGDTYVVNSPAGQFMGTGVTSWGDNYATQNPQNGTISKR